MHTIGQRDYFQRIVDEVNSRPNGLWKVSEVADQNLKPTGKVQQICGIGK